MDENNECDANHRMDKNSATMMNTKTTKERTELQTHTVDAELERQTNLHLGCYVSNKDLKSRP